METFDVESKSRKRESTSPSSFLHRSEGNKFNCLIIATLVVFTGFFVLILINFMISRHEIAPEIQSLHDSVQDSMSDDVCEPEDLCLTKECVTTSARILSFMDDSKDPCEDFYEYACANYPKLKSVRFGEDVYNPDVEATDNINIYIKRLMDASDSNSLNKSFKKVKILYDSCMNTTKRDENSSDTLLRFLNEHGLSWPVLNEEVEPKDSWTHFLAEMTKFDAEPIFKPSISIVNDPDALEIDDRIAVELQCFMPMLPPHVYLNPDEEESSAKIFFYKNVILLFLDYIGIRRSVGRTVFEDIMKLETELSRMLVTEENAFKEECQKPCSRSSCPPCKAASSTRMQHLSPEHVQQLQEIFASVFDKPAEKIILLPKCSGNFEEIMKILNAATNKTLLNYVGWRTISHLMLYMGTNYQSLYNHYAGRILEADTVPATRWRECSHLIRTTMGTIVAEALIKNNHIKQEQLDEMKKRFLDMKNAFASLMQTVTWLDNTTAKLFIEKLDGMKLQIGYPGVGSQPEILDELYENLEFNDNDTFFDNMMKLKAFLASQAFTDSGSVKDVLRELKPLETSAAYNEYNNLVEIGLGNLVSPLMKYAEDLPKYLEYGQDIVLAQQISQAFDKKRIMYDGKGRQIDPDQFPKSFQQKFFTFIACLSHQYATSSTSQQDDSTTADDVNEAIADLGAFFITEEGLKRNIDLDHGDTDGRMPGLPLTKQQIYFLQASQRFCEARETYSIRFHSKLPRRTHKERVNGAISNMVGFGNVFNCSVGTKMNPPLKCNLLS